MAKLSSDGKFVTVEAGDTLSEIAEKYTGKASNYAAIASYNGDIVNPNRIYIDQTIWLYQGPSSSSSSSSTEDTTQVTIKQFGLQSNSNNTLFVTWTWPLESSTEEYKVWWYYATGDGVSFIANKDTNSVDPDNYASSRQATFSSIPDNATKVWVRILPVYGEHKTTGVDDKSVIDTIKDAVSGSTTSSSTSSSSEWTAKWAKSKDFYTRALPPDAPGKPDAELKDSSLTATLDNINIDNADQIQFQLRVDYSDVKHKTVDVVGLRASCQFTSIQPGHVYNVRCRAFNSAHELYSSWSDYTDDIYSKPAAPGGITTIYADTKTSVYLEWEASATADSYEIEYAAEEKYLGTTNRLGTVSTSDNDSPTNCAHYISGLETGDEYYFRVRAVREDVKSDWTDAKSVVVGSTPSAPTTWASTSTAIIGEDLYLYWVHNSKDGSYQTKARLGLTNNYDNTQTLYDFGSTGYTSSDGLVSYMPLTEDQKEEGVINSCTIDTTKLTAGVELDWIVQTRGVTEDYSDWSTTRTITVYERPSVSISLRTLASDGVTYEGLETDYDERFVVKSFPFYIYAVANPNNEVQKPIGYHISIVSNSYYETVDAVGREKIVTDGETIYSEYFDVSDAEFRQKFTPANLDLENGYNYTIKCTVSMSSGLTAEDSCDITVDWVATHYSPNAVITIDDETLTATIRPYCKNYKVVYYDVEHDTLVDVFNRTKTTYDYIYGEPLTDASTGETVYTTDGYKVYKTEIFIDDNFNTATVYFCVVNEVEEVTGATMDVYRREFDGTYTKINDAALDVEATTAVSDPHPALDYARYRLIATDNSTGAISYYDMPGKKVGCTSVVMQWDDNWTSFDVEEDAEPVQPAWSGSMLKLPYNIAVSDSNDRDISLVEYAGRESPVSYYGTHRGHQSTWTTDIDKTDKETLYALRRLQRWMGDVYVREPSGSGYWASVSVSFKVSYDNSSLTIPVTFNINRVEGGM